MELIRNTVEALMQSISIKQKDCDEAGVGALLKKILTNKEIKHIKFNYFKRGILSLSVDASTWLFQFNAQKENILAKLQNELPKVKELRFYLGERK